MNRPDKSDDTDWIYSSKKLKRLRKLRNPLNEHKKDLKENMEPKTVLDKKDPIFDEVIASPINRRLKKAVEQKTSLNRSKDKNELHTTKRIQPKSIDTIRSQADTTPDPEDIKKSIHRYDPLCNCDRCSI